VQRMKQLMNSSEDPKSLALLINAGAIPPNHWTQNVAVGGGRIIGEACHFIDLARFLVGQPVVEVKTVGMRGRGGIVDTAQISLKFGDGSIASIQYFANGHRSFPKERIEVFASGRILQLDNFRTLRGFGWPGFGRDRAWKQDKGHSGSIQAFLSAVSSGGHSPIPADEIFE